MGAEDQKKWLYEYIDIPNFRISNFELTQATNDVPEATVKINLELTSYASQSGKRMFLPLNLMSKWESIPPKLKQRKQQILRAGPEIGLKA
jgi:hypothetical protein